jgi:hypothetical protein
LRAGITYGLIGAVLIVFINIVNVTHLTGRSFGFLGRLVGFLLLILAIYGVLISVFAGRAAAMQTGKVSTGALAGLVADVVSTLTALPAVLVLYIVMPTTATTPFYLVPAAIFGGMPSWVVAVIEHAISTYLSLALSAGLGALGGLAGRRAYRPIA